MITEEQIINHVMKIKTETAELIKEIHVKLHEESVRTDNLEANASEVKSLLRRSEEQRKSFNDEVKKDTSMIKDDLIEVKTWFNNHDSNEMEKYDKIIDALTDLTNTLKAVQNETGLNSHTLRQKKIEEDTQRAVQDALDKQKAPFQEYKKKAILTVISILVAGTVYGGWKLTLFVANLDRIMGLPG